MTTASNTKISSSSSIRFTIPPLSIARATIAAPSIEGGELSLCCLSMVEGLIIFVLFLSFFFFFFFRGKCDFLSHARTEGNCRTRHQRSAQQSRSNEELRRPGNRDGDFSCDLVSQGGRLSSALFGQQSGRILQSSRQIQVVNKEALPKFCSSFDGTFF
jgi:hypothetical protein